MWDYIKDLREVLDFMELKYCEDNTDNFLKEVKKLERVIEFLERVRRG